MDLKINIKRIYKGNNYTIGNLFINNFYICDTLEDVVRDLKEDGSGKIMSETKAATPSPSSSSECI